MNALTQWSRFQWTDMFRSQDLHVVPLHWHATAQCQQLISLRSNNISKHDWCRAWGFNQFIIQLRYLTAPGLSSETNWRIVGVSGDDNNYHDYRPRQFDPANERNRNWLRVWVEPHSYESIKCDHQPEKLQWRRCIATMLTIIMSTGFNMTNNRNRMRFLQVNWARSSVRGPTINGAMLPLNWQSLEPKARLRDNCESAQSRPHSLNSTKVHWLQ